MGYRADPKYTHVETRECCKCGMVWSKLVEAKGYFHSTSKTDACGWCGRDIESRGWKYRKGYLLVQGKEEIA